MGHLPVLCWGLGLTAHYFYGFRASERQVRGRQESVEHLAETTHKAA